MWDLRNAFSKFLTEKLNFPNFEKKKHSDHPTTLLLYTTLSFSHYPNISKTHGYIFLRTNPQTRAGNIFEYIGENKIKNQTFTGKFFTPIDMY